MEREIEKIELYTVGAERTEEKEKSKQRSPMSQLI